MTPTTPTELRLSSFSPDGDHELERVVRIPRTNRGQQTIDIGDYQVTLTPDGELTVELGTLSGADRITVRRFHESSVTLTAKADVR